MDWFEYHKSEEKEKAEWAGIEYVNQACPSCGRHRVEICQNKKHICEKCNWVIEDSKYFYPVWRH